MTDHSQRSTAHLIEPQTIFYLVSGEKADNRRRTTVHGSQPTQLNLKRYSFPFKGRYGLLFNPGRISVK